MAKFAPLFAAGVAAIPTIKIGTDVHGKDVLQPLVGAGTWLYDDDVAYKAVCAAFEVGYNYVDTANDYANQKGVGKAIRDCWKGTREELFVMTKIQGGLNYQEALDRHRDNMNDLGLDYVDHLMIHFPADWDVTPAKTTAEARQDEWRALEKIYQDGEARSIGVSHYCVSHLNDVLETAVVKPSINQVEYHVGAGDLDHVIDKCREEGIRFMSFSPLCGPCEYEHKDSLISGDLVTSIGAKYGKHGSQVALRWIVQQALTTDYIGGVIPKSANPAHLAANIDIFDFELSDEDMVALGAATAPAGIDGYDPLGGDCTVVAPTTTVV